MAGSDSVSFRQCPSYASIEGVRVDRAYNFLASSSNGADDPGTSGSESPEAAIQRVYQYAECRAYNYRTALEAWDDFQRQHAGKVALWRSIYQLLKRAQSEMWTESSDGPSEELLVAVYARGLGLDWYECAAASSLAGTPADDSDYWLGMDTGTSDEREELRRVPFLQGMLDQAVFDSRRTDTPDEPWNNLPASVTVGDTDPSNNPFLRFGSELTGKRYTVEGTAQGLVTALEKEEVQSAFSWLVDGSHRSAQLVAIHSVVRQLWDSAVGREFLKKQWMHSFDDSAPDPTLDPRAYLEAAPADNVEAVALAEVLSELLPGLAYWHATAPDGDAGPLSAAGEFFDLLITRFGLADSWNGDYDALGRKLRPDSGGTDPSGLVELGNGILGGIDSAIESAWGRGSGPAKSLKLLFRVVGVVIASVNETEAREMPGTEAVITFAKFSNDVANVASHYIDETASRSARLASRALKQVLGPLLAVVDIATTMGDLAAEIDTGDYDAAAGAGLMAVGGLTSLVGELLFVGLASTCLIWLGVALTLAGFFLYTYLQDSPTVEWLKNCAFGRAWTEDPTAYVDPQGLDFRYRYTLPSETRTNYARQVQHLHALSRDSGDGSTGFVSIDETTTSPEEGAAVELTFDEDVLYDLRIEPFAVVLLKPILHLDDVRSGFTSMTDGEYAVGMWESLVWADKDLLSSVPWEYNHAICMAEGTTRTSADVTPSDIDTALPGFVARWGATPYWTWLMDGVNYDRWDYHSALRSIDPSVSLELSSPGFYWQRWKGRLATYADASPARLFGLVVPGEYDVKAEYVEVDVLSKTQYEQFKLLDERIGAAAGAGRLERANDLAAARRTMPVLARDRVPNPLY